MGDQSAVKGAEALRNGAAELFGAVGASDHDRRLSDKILAAFNHAYSVGEIAVADQLRSLLRQVDGSGEAEQEASDRRQRSAAHQADLWVTFVEARNRYREVSETPTSKRKAIADALDKMKEAYKTWSSV